MTTLTTECPSPGVYEGVSFDDYNAWRALSNSALTLLAKSPRHYLEGERSEQTDAMKVGELCHSGVFEPASIAERYAVMPPFELQPENCTGNGEPSDSKATKWYRAKRKEFEDANIGKEICPREIFEGMMSLVRELSLNEDANRLLNGPGPVEVSIVWDEVIPGGWSSPVRCKARLDKVAELESAIVDLKKCRDVTGFEKDIAYRRYFRQMAFYQRGWSILHDGDCLTPWLIAHEISAPLCVLAAPLSEVAIIEGNNQIDQLLSLFCQCRAADEWPGLVNPSEWNLAPFAISEPAPLVASDGREIL